MTADRDPTQCPACRQQGWLCVCADAPQIAIRTPVVVVAHVSDLPRTSSAGKVWLEALPPYAPDLNPVEWMWQHLKHVALRYLVCLDLEELHGGATATTGDGGWVDLTEPIMVRAGDGFVAVPEEGT